MRFEYKNVSLTSEIVTNNIHKLSSSQCISGSFVVETHKLGVFDDEQQHKFDAILEFSESVNQDLLSKSIYTSRGVCMYDKNPIGISFGGLIGQFTYLDNDKKITIDKDVNRVAYFYLIQK